MISMEVIAQPTSPWVGEKRTEYKIKIVVIVLVAALGTSACVNHDVYICCKPV